ncbi:MAG: phosphate acyltransferase PlsX [Gemmatimonadetes bacterium]|nr:phosphate acyltransferase PlsX [Gemmatimonadota bacterium]MBK9547569.1 phosphate acyltransferase PlsX [Gemmatimonadota bacterium]MBP6444513.1 phosphate acyltransferase PlsX [Gemmatimonadales bacterium]MBP6570485.1 phosphate acyltransferase PlsX [Gemmatimonadales bacterium]MBP7621222.1 phosphate acyltransferase PlsX [Gemmatimonadales bacterium]
MIRVALDAMGGDHAPATEVAGAALALRELPPEFSLLLVGQPDAVEAELARYPDLDRSRLTVVPAAEVVGMAEKPLAAVRKKPNSSLVIGLGLHRDGAADAFVSAGNTGALLAGGTILLGLHDGVDRATVASSFPAPDGYVLVLDAGANVDCTAKELLNFAYLGSIYARDVMGRPEPKVGLLNVGEEDEKGNAIVREAHAALRSHPRINYVGNIEGRDVVVGHPKHGRIDVVVCDGFVGNILLKFYESMGKVLGRVLKAESPGLLQSPEMAPLMRFLDYSEVGGAPLLGVKGVQIICHGSSTPIAIKNAIRYAVNSVRVGLSDHIATELSLRDAPVAE